MPGWKVENWITDSEVQEVSYSDYWANETHERSKPWYVVDGDFGKMERYLDEIGLLEDLAQCVNVLKLIRGNPLKGVGIDLAAGNLWAAPHLLRNNAIDRLYCLEYSRHRLLRHGTRVLEHYHVDQDRIVLVYGSFYNLNLPTDSVDFVFLSQALHHADDPDALLVEIGRVLKGDGVVIIIGEHCNNVFSGYLRYFAKLTVAATIPESIQRRMFGKTFRASKLFPKVCELFPPNPVLGDHYYTIGEYRSLFSKYGFDFRRLRRRGANFQSFVLFRR